MIHPEQQRRAYLEAIGIDLWVARADADEEELSSALADERDSGSDSELESAQSSVNSLDWQGLRERVASCTQCALSQSRVQTVFGVGQQDAEWMIIGEAPGAEEDRRGEPFVGRAGSLLNEMLRAIGQSRESVFIANVLKCRPPNNRDPKAPEAAACRGYLERQIELVQPKIILAVGKIAAQNLLGCDDPVGSMRGRRHEINGIPLVVTYHPAYLLRSPSQKRKSWSDLCLAARLAKESRT